MKTEKMKKKYCKPTIRVVEWDFNESICTRIIVNSPYIKMVKGAKKSAIETRNEGSEEYWKWRP